MRSTLTIGVFHGIPLKVHWSFLLIFGIISFNAYTNNYSWQETLWLSILILSLFVCVVLHEYGHAYAAKKFGVQTQDIILMPIGGVARLINMPEKPKYEFIIAIAGPLVNVVLAMIFGIILCTTHQDVFQLMAQSGERLSNGTDFLISMLAMNIVLLVFNMIPAFPMDGGRVLRALLSMKLGHLRATQIAGAIGKILAFGFVLLGAYYEAITTILIGFFIYFMAGIEQRDVSLKYTLANKFAKDIYRNTFTKISITDTFEKIIESNRRNGENNFLVFDQMNQVVGVVPNIFLQKIIKSKKTSDQVLYHLTMSYALVSSQLPLSEVYEMLYRKGLDIIGVIENSEVIGVIDRESFRRIY